ncbi:TetR-like C-terminal domain-containing protein [Kitasatospora sp. NPDC059599]|uniref:TetR-like C-terminal domain-containing protein n=1 Tax=Kitasatospora sp. NPDC059599 TaxID=3346880 RepID=UPI0036872431
MPEALPADEGGRQLHDRHAQPLTEGPAREAGDVAEHQVGRSSARSSTTPRCTPSTAPVCWTRCWRSPATACAAPARPAGIAPDADLGLAVELLYGPLYYRWLYRLGPLTHDHADRLVDAVLRALNPPGTANA